MRIAHILGSLGMGGAERVALDLAYEQQALGHEVLAISLDAKAGGPLASEFDADKITVHHIPKRSGVDWTLPPRIARFLVQNKIDVVHTHNSKPLIYAAAAGRICRRAVIHSKHGEGHLVSRAGQLLRKAGAPFVHQFVCVSEATAEHARSQGAYPFPSRMQVIPNGIRMDRHHPDPEARAEIRKSLGIADDAWVVGTIGRVDDNKNQSLLIRAMSELLGDKVHLLIVGDGISMDKVQSAAKAASRPDCVHVLGRRNDANRILAAMDVFALTSLSEGLPLVILEAMATGVTVVSSAVGGIAKVITDTQTGILVAAADEAALRDALASLLGEPIRAKQLAAAAREEVLKSYSAARMAKEYLALYQAAL